MPRWCMNPLRCHLNAPLRIHTLRISQGITPNNRQVLRMRNSHRGQMDNELNISLCTPLVRNRNSGNLIEECVKCLTVHPFR